MKIYQKLILAFAAVSLPLVLVSILIVTSTRHQVADLGEFQSPPMYLIQDLGLQALAAVEESFAYVVSGGESEKADFLKWAEEFTERMGEYARVDKLELSESGVERELHQKILSAQITLVKNAQTMFDEYESKGKVSDRVFSQYEVAVNELRANFAKLIQNEKDDVDEAQKEALQLIKRNELIIMFLGLLSLILAIAAGSFMARAICKPIFELKHAGEQISDGNFNIHIASESKKDEIGDLARSISHMARDLNERHVALEESNAQNARLFEEAERRAEEQEAVNAIAKATSQSLDRDELLEIALAKVLEVTGRERVSIRLKDPSTGQISLAAHRGFSQEEIEDLLRKMSHPASDRVFASGQPLVVNDRRELHNSQSLLPQSHSVAWIPIKAGANVVGVLGISTTRPVPFDQREIDLLQAIANVMGVALENARLFQETEQRNRELQALYTVTSTITHSLHIGTLMQAALKTTIDVLGVDAGRLYVLDEKSQGLRLAAYHGLSADQISGIERYAPGEGIIGRIFTESQPIVFSDISADPNYKSIARSQTGKDLGFRSAAGLPITVKDRPIGVIYVYGRTPRDFTQKEMGLFSVIGGQIGVALENARLFEETQRNLHRIQALREIDQAINSTLDLRRVLDLLLEKIELFLPYPAATAVRLFNSETGLIEPMACRNLDEKEWKAEMWKSGRGTANRVFETNAPVTIRNVQTDPDTKDVEFFRKYQLLSYLGVPLVAKGRILGVLSFYTKEEQEFGSEEVELLSTLAGQAAIAIHNSQLYEEAQTRESQLKETNRMLSALHAVAAAATGSLDLDRVFQAAIEKITDIFRFDATKIYAYDEQTDEVLLRASFDKDPDQFTRTRSYKRGEGIVGKVAESGKPLIFEDVQTDPLYQQLSRTKVSGQFGYHFFAVLPIKGKMTILGTLGCIGGAPRKLSTSEIQLLEAIAERIGVAIENNTLYENVRQKVKELEQKTAELERANKVKDEFLSVMSHELRTPLNVVMGYTGMIKDRMLGETNPQQAQALEKILSRTNDLLTMITSILYATSIEAHEVQVDSHQFALVDFLEELRAGQETQLSKPLSVKWDYPAHLPVVESDSAKLKTILQNLITNAIKFTEVGQVTVWARMKAGSGQCATGHPPGSANGEEQAESGEEVVMEFRVADTGIGIPKEKLPIIFEKFRQGDSSETRLYGGVGLGLYIAKNFTELLGGKIEVETAVGKGSTFTVTIPCLAYPSPPSTKENNRQEPLGDRKSINPMEDSSASSTRRS